MALMISGIFLILICPILMFDSIKLELEHRFTATEMWQKLGVMTVTLNKENMKYKLENLDESNGIGFSEGKEQLEVKS